MRFLVPLLLGVTAAHAQNLVKTCLPEDDAGNGLSLAVDARGQVHLSRIFRILGNLNHTVVGVDGQPANEELAQRVSVLGGDEVNTTDLVLEDGQPRICFHNAGMRVFEVALLEPAGWQREVVAMGRGAGRWCNLMVQAGRLTVVFGGDDGVVHVARRMAANRWVTEDVDALPNRSLTVDGSATLVNGRIVVAHRTDLDELRITWEQPRGYLSENVADLPLPSGVDPVAVASGGPDLWVLHGYVSTPGTSDGGLVLTQGTPGAFRSGLVSAAELGGANGGALVGGRLQAVTRYYRRNAVFGSADGLRVFNGLPQQFGFVSLQENPGADQRHTWNNLDMALDPFGLPVIAVQDEAEPFGADRGSARVCLWRPADRDGDGLPDDAEARYGADINNPDTDGDGRRDGDEVFDGTDPAGAGMLDPPDSGVLPADAGVGPVDAGDVDAEMAAVEDAGTAADAQQQPGDAQVRDAQPGDGALTDMARPDPPADEGLTDGERPVVDGRIGDMSARDAAVRDRGTEPRPDGTVADRGPDPGADAASNTVGGGSDGCAQAPGSHRAGWALLLLALPLLRRRRS